MQYASYLAYASSSGGQQVEQKHPGRGRADEFPAWPFGRYMGRVVMATDTNRVVVVIPEDAYKQNEVYRPWKDIKSSEKLARPEGALTRPQWPSGAN